MKTYQINQNLEAMIKQLYEFWFLQYDFPNEEGKPYRSNGGKMTPVEKRTVNIPEGWEIRRFKDFVNIFTGKKDVSKVTPGDYKFFSCAPDPITSNEFIYDGEAILVSGNGSYTGRVSFYKGKMDLYQRTYGCSLKVEEAIMPFLYCTMKFVFQPLNSGGKHGSSIPYIVLGDLADFEIPYNKEVAEMFSKRVAPLFYKLMTSGMDEIENLSKQRNELLPLLMNGQVSVRQLNSDLFVSYII